MGDSLSSSAEPSTSSAMRRFLWGGMLVSGARAEKVAGGDGFKQRVRDALLPLPLEIPDRCGEAG